MGATRERRVLGLMTAAAVLVAWLPPLGSGLWLDETGTAFVIGGSWRQMVERSLTWQGQSPLYYGVAWLFAHVGGAHEPVLRLPSLLAMLATLVVLQRLAARLVDESAAWLAVLFFASTRGVAFFAADARPYGLALLLALVATDRLLRWQAGGRRVDALLYALTAALMLYAHYLFAVGFAVHAAWLLATGRGQIRGAALVAALALVALLMLPLAPQLASLFGRREALAFASPPTLQRLGEALLPAAALLGGLAGLAAARLAGQSLGWQRPPAPAPRTLAAIGAWLVLPPLALFLAGALGIMQLFVPRYFLVAAPAQALLLAWLVRGLPTPATRVSAAAGVALASLFALAQPLSRHGTEDWRLAIDAARPLVAHDTPVLLESGFVESARLAAGRDPELRQWLLAPLSFYPLDAAVEPLPYGLDDPGAVAYLDRLLSQVAGRDRIVLIARSPTYAAWLDGRLAPAGWVGRRVAGYGTGPQAAAAVLVFDRR